MSISEHERIYAEMITSILYLYFLGLQILYVAAIQQQQIHSFVARYARIMQNRTKGIFYGRNTYINKPFRLLYSINQNKISLQGSLSFFCVCYSNHHRHYHNLFVRSDISPEYLLFCLFLLYLAICLYIGDNNQYQLRTFTLIAFLLNNQDIAISCLISS